MNEIVFRFYRVKISQSRFFNFVPYSVNIVSFFDKLNGVAKEVSDIFLISNKNCRVILENLSKRKPKKKKTISFYFLDKTV